MGIGKRIREARKLRNFTQKELAAKIGVTKGAIGNYENETSHPKEPVLYALMDALDVDANFLFQDVAKENKPSAAAEGKDILQTMFESLSDEHKALVWERIQTLAELEKQSKK